MCDTRKWATKSWRRGQAWLSRLGTELGRSPLSQITFVLAVGGTLLGVIAGWASFVHFIQNSWALLVLSLVAGVVSVYGLGRYGAASERAEQEERFRHVRKLLDRRLDAGVSLTRQEALDILRQEYPDSAENLLSAITSNGYYEVNYAGEIRRTDK